MGEHTYALFIGLHSSSVSDGVSDTGGCGDSGFSEFYKQTIGGDDDDTNNYGIDRPDFPRLLNNNIDAFQYYTVDKFNDKFKVGTTTSQLSVININC